MSTILSLAYCSLRAAFRSSSIAYRKYFRHWIDAHVLGLASARACGAAQAEARMRVQLGYAYLNLGRQEQAREEFTRALTLARQERHRIGEATALEHSLGHTYLKAGKPDDAVRSLEEALGIMVSLGGRYEQARIRSALADALLQLGQADPARDHLAAALVIYSEIDAPEAGDMRHRLGQLGPADDAGAGAGPS